MKQSTSLTILLAAAALAFGCASVPTRLYTLTPTAKSVGGASTLLITVGPVSVPAAVDRPQLVLNVAPNRLRADEFNRWASPLKTDIARIVAENLSRLLGSPYVSTFPESVSLSPSHRVTLDVLAFESVPGETARLTAIWSIRPMADAPPVRGRTDLAEPVPENTCEALVAAHSRMLGRLSVDIATAILALTKAADASPQSSP